MFSHPLELEASPRKKERKKEWVPPQNCFQNALKFQTPKKGKSWRIRAALKTQILPQQSASVCIKIPQNSYFDSKADTDTVLNEHKISEHFLFSEKDQSDARSLRLEKSECIFQKEKVNKSASVLHRVWSNEKTTLQKPNFSKTPRFALKPSKLPEGPLWANLRRRVLSHLAQDTCLRESRPLARAERKGAQPWRLSDLSERRSTRRGRW